MQNVTNLLVLFLIVISVSYSQIPQTISWQGIIQDGEGNNLNGQFNITVRLLDLAVNGSPLWSETHNNVQIVNGFANIVLGSVTALNLPFDKEYWLEIQVLNNTPLPRIKLTAVPYSLFSKKTSGIIQSDSLVMKDSRGVTRMVLNPNTGTFRMMNNDTTWYEIQVNSPLSLFMKGDLGLKTKEYTQGGKKITELINEETNRTILKKEEEIDPVSNDRTNTTFFYEYDGNIHHKGESIYYAATGSTYNEDNFFDSEGNVVRTTKEWNYGLGAVFPYVPGTNVREEYENGVLISKTSSEPKTNSNTFMSTEYGEAYSSTTEQTENGTSLKHSTLNQFYNQVRNSGGIGGYKIGVGDNQNTVTSGFTFDNFGGVHVTPSNGYPFFVQGNSSIIGNSYINGNQTITGSLVVQGTKNFRIDHPFEPDTKYLQHAAIESNEVLNQYSGNIITDKDGMAIVRLPDYITEINIDFRYQLTVIGEFAQAIILKEIRDNEFTIKTDKPNIKVSWLINAKRNDKYLQEHQFYDVINK